MGEIFSTLTLKAALFLAPSIVAFLVAYFMMQSGLSAKPLLTWPTRIAALIGTAYLTPFIAELFGIVGFIPDGKLGLVFLAALLSASVCLFCALLLSDKKRP
jgi:hypothetical protein